MLLLILGIRVYGQPAPTTRLIEPEEFAGEPGQWVFVESAPIGFPVYVDGVSVGQSTPALVFLTPEHHEISIRDGDRVVGAQSFASAAGPPEVVQFEPVSRSTVIVISGVSHGVQAGQLQSFPDQQITLADPSLLQLRDGRVAVEPVYPYASAQTVAGTTAVVSGITAGLLATEWVLHGSGSILDQPLLVTALLSSLTSGTGSIFLSRNRAAYESAVVAGRSESVPMFDADAAFQDAESQFGSGRLEAAQSSYLQILLEAPRSTWVPSALLRLAQISINEGETGLAQAILTVILKRYPSSSVYDRSAKALADLLFLLGRPEESAAAVDLMFFVDPFYTREEMEQYRRAVLSSTDQAAPVNDDSSGAATLIERAVTEIALGSVSSVTLAEVRRRRDLAPTDSAEAMEWSLIEFLLTPPERRSLPAETVRLEPVPRSVPVLAGVSAAGLLAYTTLMLFSEDLGIPSRTAAIAAYPSVALSVGATSALVAILQNDTKRRSELPAGALRHTDGIDYAEAVQRQRLIDTINYADRVTPALRTASVAGWTVTALGVGGLITGLVLGAEAWERYSTAVFTQDAAEQRQYVDLYSRLVTASGFVAAAGTTIGTISLLLIPDHEELARALAATQ